MFKLLCSICLPIMDHSQLKVIVLKGGMEQHVVFKREGRLVSINAFVNCQQKYQ